MSDDTLFGGGSEVSEEGTALDSAAEEVDLLVGEVSVGGSADAEVAKSDTSDEEKLALEILKRAASLKGVRIDRETFLRTELSKHCATDVVAEAIATTTQLAGVPMDVMDAVAEDVINLETGKVAGLSALAGMPGGLVMFGTVPADLANYFAHVLRVEQKLAYVYGWESFLDENDEIDDETMTKLIMFLGVIMQVGGINVSLANFASHTAMVGVAKTIQKQALTKTAWYPILKKVLSVVGVKVTKQSFAEVVAKGVPVAGGVISGGLTYATFRPGAASLKNHLRLLPQATGVAMDDAGVVALLDAEDEREKASMAERVEAAREAAVDFGERAADAAEKGAAVAADFGGRAASVAADVGGKAAVAAAAGLRRGIGGLASRIARSAGVDDGAGDADERASAVDQLREFKALLDEGIISQEDFEEKKRQLLGL